MKKISALIGLALVASTFALPVTAATPFNEVGAVCQGSL